MEKVPDDISFFEDGEFSEEEAMLAQLKFEEQYSDQELQAFEEEFDAYEEEQKKQGKGPRITDIAEFNLPSEEEFLAGSPRFIPKFLHGLIGQAVHAQEDDRKIQDIFIKIRPLLIDKERILYICTQRRPIINFLPDALILTTRRMIYYRNKLFGFTLEDAKWTEVPVCGLYEDLFGVHLLFAHKDKITFYPIRYLRRMPGRDAYTVAMEMGYRAKRKARMFIYRTAMSKVPQIMINSHGTYGAEIFDGLIPKTKVPLVARGKGFVEFSEVLDGADGRRTYTPITEEDVVKIQEMATDRQRELQEDAHKQISREVQQAKPAAKPKRIRHLDEKTLSAVEDKVEDATHEAQLAKIQKAAEQGSLVAKKMTRQEAAQAARESRRAAIQQEQDVRRKKSKGK